MTPSPSTTLVGSSSICSAPRCSNRRPALAEQDRDQVDLDLVEDAGGQRQLGDAGAVDEDVLVAGGLLGAGHRGGEVVDVGDERPLRRVGGRLWRLRMKIGTPSWWSPPQSSGGLEGPAAGDHGAGGHALVLDLAVDAGRAGRDSSGLGGARRRPTRAAARRRRRGRCRARSLGPAMKPSRDIDM